MAEHHRVGDTPALDTLRTDTDAHILINSLDPHSCTTGRRWMGHATARGKIGTMSSTIDDLGI
jgi:hypothetical protein